MAKLNVKIHMQEKALQEKLEAFRKDPETMLAIHTDFAKVIDPWVPYLHGFLSQKTIQITPECVRYTQPYARYQYYGVGFNHTKDVHPLASAMWDKVAMQTQRAKFIADVTQILKRRAKELNGG